MRTSKITKPNEAGFALLISLIVVGVVLSVGMTILDLSTKQVKLATNTRDSEVAFHAANAGSECAQYTRRAFKTNMRDGLPIEPVCFGYDPSEVDEDDPVRNFNRNSEIDGSDIDGEDGQVFQYKYVFTWGKKEAVRCSAVNTVILKAGLDEDLTLFNVPEFMFGFPDQDPDPNNEDFDFLCNAGTLCTLMSIKGYNKPCTSTSTYGTVQREVLLQS